MGRAAGAKETRVKGVRRPAPGKSAARKRANAPKVAGRKWQRENADQRRDRALEVLRRLRAEYPEARTALHHRNAYELLVATILSAQCTDERVNQVTPALFARYPAPIDLAGARPDELQEMIRSTGFFRNKTKSLLGMSNAVVDRFGGRIPNSMEDLVTLPGVGRKTANVVLGNAFGKDEGVVVDTHVARLSQRLKFTKQREPLRIEPDLMKLFPRTDWTELAHVLIFHGRAVCRAPRPRCEACVVSDLCPSSRV
jgi:endonuclease-3